MILNVLIATYLPEGISRVEKMRLPKVANVTYIISWQNHCNALIPESLKARDDILVYRFDEVGVSKNRNNALKVAKGDVLLMADDDLIYSSDQLNTVMKIFSENEELEMAIFKCEEFVNKKYSEHQLEIKETIPKNFNVSLVEIAVRRNSKAGLLRFHEKFGTNSEYLQSAEDGVYFLTAVKIGVKCKYFPITIVKHPGMSTGFRQISNNGVLKGFGGYIYMAHPFTALPRVALKAWRLKRNGQCGFFRALWHMTCGLVYAAIFVTPQWSPRYKG